MPLIASEDYPNKLIYLGADSVGVEVLPIDIYKEHRERRRLNANGERNFFPMVDAFGNDQIGPTKFTPRFVNLANGARIVPFDTTHTLVIRGSLVSTSEGIEGPELFNKAPILSSVDIDYQPPQVEVIQAGSGLDDTEREQLANLASLIELGPNGTDYQLSEVALWQVIRQMIANEARNLVLNTFQKTVPATGGPYPEASGTVVLSKIVTGDIDGDQLGLTD